jgi:hypothetical protein
MLLRLFLSRLLAMLTQRPSDIVTTDVKEMSIAKSGLGMLPSNCSNTHQKTVTHAGERQVQGIEKPFTVGMCHDLGFR